jgi:hypothetical protein
MGNNYRLSYIDDKTKTIPDIAWFVKRGRKYANEYQTKE